MENVRVICFEFKSNKDIICIYLKNILETSHTAYGLSLVFRPIYFIDFSTDQDS